MKIFSAKRAARATACTVATIAALSTGWAQASVYQWAVSVPGPVSPETNKAPQAYLWVPPACAHVRAIVIGQHNLLEQPLFDSPIFRSRLAKACIGEVWVTPMFDTVFDFSAGAGERVDGTLKALADQSGYAELATVPLVPLGHSAAASYPWNFAAWNPQRTLAIVSLKGDAPQTNMTGSGKPNPDWADRSIDGVPALMIMGEYEWLEGRIAPALSFKAHHPDAAISLYADAGKGHFDVSDDLADYIGLFIAKAADARLPKSSHGSSEKGLKPVDAHSGWRVDRWHADGTTSAQPAPASRYAGKPEDAFWYFDREIAERTYKHYLASRNKAPQLVGFTVGGTLVPQANDHAQIALPFVPLADGLSFKIATNFYDTVPGVSPNPSRWTGLPVGSPLGHSNGPITVIAETGPVVQTGPDTWSVRFDRVGFDNPRRSGDIWFTAVQNGDERYKSAVQQAILKIPVTNTGGAQQTLHFSLPETMSRKKTPSTKLNGTSDAGLPVYYYVKQGPAEISGDTLTFTAIPKSARYPVKVTVVAWQYGIAGKVDTAVPVEQTFLLTD